jgi:hypothetical protein
MRDKYPLQITEAEVLEAAMDLNFQFFADLIRYPQPIDPRAREVAAQFVLDVLTGKWGSKRQRAKMLTARRLSKMAVRVSELKKENGLESAIVQTAAEFRVTPKRVWDAWGLHLEEERWGQNLSQTVARLEAKGAPKEEGIKAVEELTATFHKEVNRRLKRKR